MHANRDHAVCMDEADAPVVADAPLRAALAPLRHGLCVFDADGRLQFCNRQFLDLFDLPTAAVAPGLPLLHLLAQSGTGGQPLPTLLERLCRRAPDAGAAESSPLQVRLSDGRTIAVDHRRLADGSFGCIFEDVSERLRLEDELRLQIERMDMALGSMNYGIALFSADERLRFCNERYRQMFGIARSLAVPGAAYRDILADAIRRGVHPRLTVDELYAKCTAAVRRRELATTELALADGRIVLTTCRPTPDGGWLADHQDVTAQRRIEQELRQQNLLFDATLETMAHGLCVFDADLRVVMRNQRFLDMFSFSAAAIRPGATVLDMTRHSIAVGNHPGRTAEEVAAEVTTRLLDDNSGGHRRKVGDRVFMIRSHPMANGQRVETTEDITELDRATTGLQEQIQRFDTALESMVHGLAMFDNDLVLVACNRRYLELFGLDPAIVRPGLTLRDIIRHRVEREGSAGVDPEQLYQQHALQLQERSGGVLQRRLASGRVIEIRNQPMTNGGRVATCEDITERVAAAQALEEQNRRFDAALENMAQGLIMLDSDMRLVVYNRRYLEIMDLDPKIVRPGIALRDLISQTFIHGNQHGGRTPDELYAEVCKLLATPGKTGLVRRMGDGRLVSICHQPLDEGGWLVTYEDITERERAAESLREQNLMFDAALENMAQGLAMFDKELRLVVCNKRYLELFGLEPEAVKPGATLYDMVCRTVERGCYGDTTPEEVYAGAAAWIATGVKSTLVRHLADGTVIAIRLQPRDGGGWVITYEDITERERASDLLRAQNLRFDAALENMAHGLCMLDENLRLIVTNRRFLDMFRLSPADATAGTSLRDVIEKSIANGNYRSASVDDMFRDFVKDLHREVSIIDRTLADGRTVQITRRRMGHGGWVATYEDITERRKAEQRIAHMARHDALTDLPNRVLFREKMDEGLSRVHLHAGMMAVLCLDLDNFKSVNDTLGHPIGDKLLMTVAERLSRVVGEHDTIARLGGDEFAILQSTSTPAAVEMLARSVVEVVAEPMIIDGHEINNAVSIGIAIAPTDGAEADHLMKCADLALYRAKSDGRGIYRFFAPEMDARIQTRRKLELDLRKALANDEFSVEFQPLVSTTDQRLVGMEALVRWRHPERGPVSPADFIPLAEDTRLIVPIGEWVLRQACTEAARWPGAVRLAVNLSPVQLKSRGFVSTVIGALSASGLPPARLELEITEAVLLQDDAGTLDMLHQLRKLGIRICMDDFGTGYSSLSYLRRFPFDKIKIDRSFVAHLAESPDGVAIVRAVAGLGASLGIGTTAEGVETQAQFDLVREHGCTEAQGYFISRPRPAAMLPELFERLLGESAAA